MERKNGVFLSYVFFLWLIFFANTAWAYPLEDTFGDQLVFANSIVNYEASVTPQQLSEADANRRISSAPDYFDNGGTTFSLGVGGAMVVEFGDNEIIGGGNADYDLFIYEVEDLENLQVSLISNQGRQFDFASGTVISVQGNDTATGQTRNTNIFQFDIDSLLGNLATDEFFQYVKIMDSSGGSGTDGADIDAIGMIAGMATTMAAVSHVSEPGSVVLLISGLLGWLIIRRYSPAANSITVGGDRRDRLSAA